MQSVAHGVVAAVTDVRAMDGSEVTVGLGRREQAAGAAVPALGRERAEEGASGGGDGVDEEGAVLAGGPGALGACIEAAALFVGLERVVLVGDGPKDGLGGGRPAGKLCEAGGVRVEGVARGGRS